MADHHSGDEIEPEVASHLADSMDEAPGPEPVHHLPPPASEGHSWPDGSGKHRHPKDQEDVRSQHVVEAAEHRISRPDIPHRDK
ncbi:hypothetical protein [Arthrobacter sp. U41]|uniref:hypothetical protein n=1 Tax=Arthrobacter sp. U41 TaxID=1849032 RepID=UPI0008595D3D|nr:hypothetical protein [Arthrobacter sp. U41]AOT03163.1 hypothetical protein ASPU41_07230 [Arthrobacter sp. U41]